MFLVITASSFVSTLLRAGAQIGRVQQRPHLDALRGGVSAGMHLGGPVCAVYRVRPSCAESKHLKSIASLAASARSRTSAARPNAPCRRPRRFGRVDKVDGDIVSQGPCGRRPQRRKRSEGLEAANITIANRPAERVQPLRKDVARAAADRSV